MSIVEINPKTSTSYSSINQGGGSLSNQKENNIPLFQEILFSFLLKRFCIYPLTITVSSSKKVINGIGKILK